MAHDVDAKVPLDPVAVDVLGPLVDGEGDGPDQRYTGHGSRHA